MLTGQAPPVRRARRGCTWSYPCEREDLGPVFGEGDRVLAVGGAATGRAAEGGFKWSVQRAL